MKFGDLTGFPALLGDPSQVDTQGSSVVDKAFQHSLLGSKCTAGVEDPSPTLYRWAIECSVHVCMKS